MANTIDERLLAGREQESAARRELKERKSGAGGETANKISFTDETML